MLKCMLAGALLAATPVAAEEVGEVTTAIKILGANHRIVVEAFDDPKVEGVACFLSRARTGGIKGSLGIAEDTSDASVSCQQTGPVKFRDELEDGEEVFSVRASLDLQARPGGALLRRDAQRAGLSHLFRPGDRGLAQEQPLRRGDPRLATRTLYHARGPVTLVGGGPVAPAELARALALAPEAIAADGGGDHPLPEGHAFRAVIGDMDSLRSGPRLAAEGVALHRRGRAGHRPTSRSASTRSRRRSSSASASSAGRSTITSRR